MVSFLPPTLPVSMFHPPLSFIQSSHADLHKNFLWIVSFPRPEMYQQSSHTFEIKSKVYQSSKALSDLPPCAVPACAGSQIPPLPTCSGPAAVICFLLHEHPSLCLPGAFPVPRTLFFLLYNVCTALFSVQQRTQTDTTLVRTSSMTLFSHCDLSSWPIFVSAFSTPGIRIL